MHMWMKLRELERKFNRQLNRWWFFCVACRYRTHRIGYLLYKRIYRPDEAVYPPHKRLYRQIRPFHLHPLRRIQMILLAQTQSM